jgi:hypothetical protein
MEPGLGQKYLCMVVSARLLISQPARLILAARLTDPRTAATINAIVMAEYATFSVPDRTITANSGL